SSQYSTVKGEIRAYRPMVYTLTYPTYGGGAGYHTVTLMGYGCLTPPWGTPLANLSNQSLDKTIDYYEYLYICHDNNTSTGTDVYLWWSQFMSDAHMVLVWPGGGSLLMSKSSSVNLFCRNYPNPFNPATEIRYSISIKSPVVIKIVNTLGQTIYTFNEGVKEPGSYSVHWDGCDDSGVLVAGGIYYYLLQAGNEKKTGKMTLVR
ncbi:MAG: T9SS type A sorting domain-containing protein, partial [candidate division KSB1 bacterium]|nr:T9SS type A sorting domain-containing protein [candidate division KSB1 bacterium]